MSSSTMLEKSRSIADNIRFQMDDGPAARLCALLAGVGAFSLACLFYLSLIINISFPFKKPSVDSPVVGWVTLHEYPKQQETFYYLLGIVCIVGITVATLAAWNVFSSAAATGNTTSLRIIRKWSALLVLPAAWKLYNVLAHWPPPKDVPVLWPTLCLIVALHALAFVIFRSGPSRVKGLWQDSPIYVVLVLMSGLLLACYIPFITPTIIGNALAQAWIACPLMFLALWIGVSEHLSMKSRQPLPNVGAVLATVCLPLAGLTACIFFLQSYTSRIAIVAAAFAAAITIGYLCVRRIRSGNTTALVSTTLVHVWFVAVVGIIAAETVLVLNPYFSHGTTITALDGDYLTTWMYDGLHGKFAFRGDYYYPYGPLVYLHQLVVAKWFGLDRYAFLNTVADAAGSACLLYVIARILFVTPVFAVIGGLLVMYQMPSLRVLIALMGLVVLVRGLNTLSRKMVTGAGIILAAAVLYSIEAALCGIVSGIVIYGVAYLQSGQNVRLQLRALAFRFPAGLAVVLLPALAVGALAGGLQGFIHSIARTLSIVDSCCGSPFPSLLSERPVTAGVLAFLKDGIFRVFYMPVVIYVIACIVLMLRFLKGGEFTRNDRLLLATVAFGGLLFRSALGRSEAGHAAFASVPVFLVGTMLGERLFGGLRHALQRAFPGGTGARDSPNAAIVDRAYYITEAAALGAVVLALFVLPGWAEVLVNRVGRDTELIRNFHQYADKTPPNLDPSLTVMRTPDGEVFWFRGDVGQKVNEITQYLRGHLGSGDQFFCFPFTTRYYVLLGQTSLGTFGPEIWSGAARPEDQEHLINILKFERPKYVVYDESEWPDTDGVPWMDRSRLINRYLFENFHVETRIGPAVILRLGNPGRETPSRLRIGDFSDQQFLLSGWYYPTTMGQPGRWTTTHATAKLKCPPGVTNLYIKTSLTAPMDRIFSLAVEGRTVFTASLAGRSGNQTFHADIPAEFQGRDVNVDLRLSAPLVANDLRRLGLWVTELGFRTPGFPTFTGKEISGHGSEGLLELEYTDPDGADDISWSQMIINSSLNGLNSCYLNYRNDSNMLSLSQDNGTAWSSAAIGSNQHLENSQCEIDVSKSSAKRDDRRLILRVAVRLKPEFRGQKTIYTTARDKEDQQAKEWQVVGTWETTR